MKSVFAIVVVIFLLSPLLALRVNPDSYEGGRDRDVRARAERNSSALALLLGEFRASMSDIMFIKTERYLHSGVGYTPHMDNQLLSLEGETAGLTEHQAEVGLEEEGGEEHDDEAMTLLRTPDNDFRGFIGSLEREVQPWRDPSLPHIHTLGTELLPWYRIMTLSDPYNERAYAIGAWWLKSIDPEEGIRFLEEGIRNNPDSFQLFNMLGQIYNALGNEARWAEGGEEEDYLPLYRKAQEAFEKGAELALVQRPAEGPTPQNSTWTEYMEEDAMATIRMAVLVERNYGDEARALELAVRYSKSVEDAVLNRVIHGIEENETQ